MIHRDKSAKRTKESAGEQHWLTVGEPLGGASQMRKRQGKPEE